LRQQEIEGAVNDRRGDAFSSGAAIQFRQYIVGAERLVASQQDFQHLAAARSQAQLARFAQAPRRRQQLPLTTTMVVLLESDAG
jgi:hypothetical protein